MSVELTYESLGRNGLGEVVNRALGEIVANIGDINTDAKKARKMTVEVVFKPNQERNFPVVSYSVKTATAPVAPVEVTAMIETTRDGKSTIHIPQIGTDPAQHELPVNVTSIREAKNG